VTTVALNRDTQPMARIDMIDSLRGFALMGLFLVHACEYFELYWLHPPAHNAIHEWVFGLFAGKAFAMFALLFGLSFFIIMDRAAQKGIDFSGRFIWRLVVLGGIGFFHTLFYGGDILQVLALCGLCLIFVNKLSAKWLVPLAVICLAEPVLIYQFVHMLHDPAANINPLSWQYPALEVYAHGTLWQLFQVNLVPSNKWEFMWEAGRIFQILGLFLCGLMLGRIGFFKAPQNFVISRRIGFLLALSVAVGLHFAKPWIAAQWPGDQAHHVVAWARDGLFDSYQNLAAMTLWVLGLIELYQIKPFQSVLQLLAPAGRMTLSFYVMQAVICVPLYYGFGLSWYEHIGQFRALLFGMGFFTAQLICAHLWFKRFYYGPLEWLWRALTYLSFKVPFVRKGA